VYVYVVEMKIIQKHDAEYHALDLDGFDVVSSCSREEGDGLVNTHGGGGSPVVAIHCFWVR
jgi:hypothetical protein